MHALHLRGDSAPAQIDAGHAEIALERIAGDVDLQRLSVRSQREMQVGKTAPGHAQILDIDIDSTQKVPTTATRAEQVDPATHVQRLCMAIDEKSRGWQFLG